MTRKPESTYIETYAKSGGRMGLLDLDCSPKQLAARDEIVSHINVARMILSTRLDQGLTQEELGRAAGTKQSRISEIEALKGNPRFDTLDRIATVLGLMITLVPRSEPVPEPKVTAQTWLVYTAFQPGKFSYVGNKFNGGMAGTTEPKMHQELSTFEFADG